KAEQPHTLFIGSGFNYHLRELSTENVQRKAVSKFIFPKEMVLAGYTTDLLGYGVNNFLSQKATIFWGGEAHVQQGFSLSYQRNIFHTRKVFAMDWAAGIGIWRSKIKGENFFTVSLNPVLHFNAIRTKPLDLFFEYSVAGPSFISKTKVDDVRLGRKFTFHDFMGLGVFAGKKRKLFAGLRIAHYSNGNLFPENDGVKVPLTLDLGYIIR
ncbi:MAG TPA: acyloxyacyl hydrolase, partial [Chitinophagaceae bacterium]|nr:acyloxyacyl hydrolase [Chitinophagaceae bacterium]